MRVTTVNIPIERLEQLFYAFDLDMDSYIDQSELHTLIHKSYAMFEHTLSLDSWSALVRTLALHMDINSDGMLAISEVITAFSQI
jgi:Ca2+-binding EF-hand superfamily protein